MAQLLVLAPDEPVMPSRTPAREVLPAEPVNEVPDEAEGAMLADEPHSGSDSSEEDARRVDEGNAGRRQQSGAAPGRSAATLDSLRALAAAMPVCGHLWSCVFRDFELAYYGSAPPSLPSHLPHSLLPALCTLQVPGEDWRAYAERLRGAAMEAVAEGAALAAKLDSTAVCA